jgi:adenosylmethionine-8-amino-7-oxononanoate aminotransferase
MTVCDPEEGMHSLFAGVLPAQFVVDLPRDEAGENALDAVLRDHAYEIAAILVEPLVQGAGGMIFHDAAALQRLRRLADKHGVLLIFDEIFTGFGRTGSLFAMESAGVTPDIVTLSKALTGGVLPLSAAIASTRVFNAFLSDRADAALMHGPTYMANPLACAAANASLDLFEQGAWKQDVPRIEAGLRAALAPCGKSSVVKDVRVMGAIGVVELHKAPDHGALSAFFVEQGVWIRPMGRVIYLTPALTASEDDIAQLGAAICGHTSSADGIR